jgi:hypothetical protein
MQMSSASELIVFGLVVIAIGTVILIAGEVWRIRRRGGALK